MLEKKYNESQTPSTHTPEVPISEQELMDAFHTVDLLCQEWDNHLSRNVRHFSAYRSKWQQLRNDFPQEEELYQQNVKRQEDLQLKSNVFFDRVFWFWELRQRFRVRLTEIAQKITVDAFPTVVVTREQVGMY